MTAKTPHRRKNRTQIETTDFLAAAQVHRFRRARIHHTKQMLFSLRMYQTRACILARFNCAEPSVVYVARQIPRLDAPVCHTHGKRISAEIANPRLLAIRNGANRRGRLQTDEFLTLELLPQPVTVRAASTIFCY